MPWKAKRPVDLKMEFVMRRRGGERMSDLCREYGINRQTGYEIWNRFSRLGGEALLPQSRAPKRRPWKTPVEVAELLVAERKAHPSWGPRKLKAVIELARSVKLPSPTTISSILGQHGLLERRKRRSNFSRSWSSGLREPKAPNDVWGADYKGQFRLGDASYCYPLTISDLRSRSILACEGMSAINEDVAYEVSLQTFAKFGLPDAIRTDNGVPFASVGLANLSKLSVLWLRLGIDLERIDPGQPQQNGCHERMHRTLKRETTRPASSNLLQQQERFDRFLEEFNQVRPHEALDQKRPADVYKPSARKLPEKIPEPSYPMHDDAVVLNSSGDLRVAGRKYHLSSALAGELVGIVEEDDGRWRVSFTSIDLGHVDPQSKSFEPTTLAPPAG